MVQNRCPICGQEYKYDTRHSGREKPCIGGHCDEYGFLSYYCGHFDFEFSIEESIISSSDSEWRDKLLNLATEQMLHARCGTADDEDEKWHFYYDDIGKKHFSQSPKHINLANHLTNYPAQTIDVAHRVLLNLCFKYPHYGDIICPIWMDRRLFFQCENNNAGNCGIMRVLEDFGYVKDPSDNECYSSLFLHNRLLLSYILLLFFGFALYHTDLNAKLLCATGVSLQFLKQLDC